jgi:hypothetical protein
MKKALVVLFVVVFAASALASVEIFVTSANPANAGYIGGLSNAALNFDPTGDLSKDLSPKATPLYRLDRNVLLQTPVMPTINPLTDGDTLYIWFQFVLEPVAQKIQGVQVGWTAPSGMITDLSYPVVDNVAGVTGGSTATLGKRWDGAYTGPTDPEFKQNPQVLAAVQTWGLVNLDLPKRWTGTGWTTAGTGAGENLQGEFQYVEPDEVLGSTIQLLGAIKVLPGHYDLTPYIGELGIAKYPGGVLYPSNEIQIFGAHITPEPASMLLIGLGLLLRRR